MKSDVITNMKAQMQPTPAVIDQLVTQITLLDTSEDNSNKEKVTHKKSRLGYRVAMVAIIALMIMGILYTDIGQSVAERIESWLTPQKVSHSIEGYEEEVYVVPSYDYDEETIAKGMAEYVIYYDKEMFATERKNGIETIYGLSNKNATLTIEQVADVNATQQLKDIIKKEKIKNYEKSEEISPAYAYEGIWYTDGLEYDDMMYRIYTIDNGKGGCFIIRTQNTIEAEEGFGSQFIEMIQDFLIVEE